MFGFDKKKKLIDWEIKILNISATALNEQRMEYLSTAAADPDFAVKAANLEESALIFFENAFLWGLYKTVLPTCPVKVDSATEIMRLIELREISRETSSQRAKEIADAAQVHATSGNETFELLSRIGSGAILKPEEMAGALTEFFRQLVRQQEHSIVSNP